MQPFNILTRRVNRPDAVEKVKGQAAEEGKADALKAKAEFDALKKEGEKTQAKADGLESEIKKLIKDWQPDYLRV